jgi:hypothetical protein
MKAKELWRTYKSHLPISYSKLIIVDKEQEGGAKSPTYFEIKKYPVSFFPDTQLFKQISLISNDEK